jgi:hypothetical protein
MAFACRSGGWVPAWCDDQWQQFIDAFLGRAVSVDDNLRPRWSHHTANGLPPSGTAAGRAGHR